MPSWFPLSRATPPPPVVLAAGDFSALDTISSSPLSSSSPPTTSSSSAALLPPPTSSSVELKLLVPPRSFSLEREAKDSGREIESRTQEANDLATLLKDTAPSNSSSLSITIPPQRASREAALGDVPPSPLPPPLRSPPCPLWCNTCSSSASKLLPSRPACLTRAAASLASHLERLMASRAVGALRLALKFLHKVFTFNLLPKKCPFDLLPLELWGFCKFFCTTIASFCLGFKLTRINMSRELGEMGLPDYPREYDWDYTLSDFAVFELQPILGDTALYYVFGQLYVDDFVGAPTLAWLSTTCCSMMLLNVVGKGIQITVSEHSMRCMWKAKEWVCVISVVSVIVAALLLHFYVAWRDGKWKQRLFFGVSTVVLFVLPIISNPNAHFHHYFWSWLIGMQAGLHKYWWSTLCSGVLWGVYLNGVAQYGRDDVLGCYQSLYRAKNQGCPFLTCSEAQTPVGMAAGRRLDWLDGIAGKYDCSTHQPP